jgi:hypothetical protein
MKIYKLNIKLILISTALSLFIIGIFYYFLYSNNNKSITYIDIGSIAGSPALKPQLEIKKLEDFSESNKSVKIKPKYIKDLNILEIHFEYKNNNSEVVHELSEKIEKDILTRALNEVNKNIKKRQELNDEFIKLFKGEKLFITGDALAKNFDIRYITTPYVYYTKEQKYINITLLLGLFTILSISFYLILLILNDNKIKR